jgi:hypothetical protein
MIYFAQATDGGPIKIGTSDHPEKRVKDIGARINKDMRIIGLTKGQIEEERKLHERFSNSRVGDSEWFMPDVELVEFIETLPKNMSPKPSHAWLSKEEATDLLQSSLYRSMFCADSEYLRVRKLQGTVTLYCRIDIERLARRRVPTSAAAQLKIRLASQSLSEVPGFNVSGPLRDGNAVLEATA